jgi:hypothetical protein
MKRLDEILKRCEAATKGNFPRNKFGFVHEEDERFVRYARTDLPLVVKALQTAVEAIGELTHPRDSQYSTAIAEHVLAEIEALLEEK